MNRKLEKHIKMTKHEHFFFAFDLYSHTEISSNIYPQAQSQNTEHEKWGKQFLSLINFN